MTGDLHGRVLDVVVSWQKLILVDSALRWRGCARRARTVECVVIVIPPEIAAMTDARRSLAVFRDILNVNDNRIELVLNQRAPHPPLDRAAVESILGRKMSVSIGFDDSRPEDAALAGGLILVRDPNSLVSRGVTDLARVILANLKMDGLSRASSPEWPRARRLALLAPPFNTAARPGNRCGVRDLGANPHHPRGRGSRARSGLRVRDSTSDAARDGARYVAGKTSSMNGPGMRGSAPGDCRPQGRITSNGQLPDQVGHGPPFVVHGYTGRRGSGGGRRCTAGPSADCTGSVNNAANSEVDVYVLFRHSTT